MSVLFMIHFDPAHFLCSHPGWPLQLGQFTRPGLGVPENSRSFRCGRCETAKRRRGVSCTNELDQLPALPGSWDMDGPRVRDGICWTWEMFGDVLRISANSNSVSPFNASYHCRVISNLYCSTVRASNVTRRGAICGHGSKITRSTRQPKLPPTPFWFHRDNHWISNRTTLWTYCACRRLLAGPFRGNGASSRIRIRGLAF